MEKTKRDELKHFRRHLAAYLFCMVVLLLIDLAWPEGAWFFWPALVWGTLLFLHYIFVRSRRVDNDWADRRAADVAAKAYDFGHVQDLQQRYGDEPGKERKGDGQGS